MRRNVQYIYADRVAPEKRYSSSRLPHPQFACDLSLEVSMLTKTRLKEVLSYNSKTGIFKWKKATTNSVKAESNAGYINTINRCCIGIDGKYYLRSRLAWLYTYGYFPETDIDHINRIPSDDRITNLRMVSRQCNLRNCGLRVENTSGVKGVGFYSRDKLWEARIGIANKTHYLGRFESFTEAVAHRLAAEQCIGWSNCDTSSTAFIFMQKYLESQKCLK